MTEMHELVAGAAVVHPGDKLIIGLSSTHNPDDLGAIVDAIKAKLDGIEICIMDQVSAMVVVRGGDPRA